MRIAMYVPDVGIRGARSCNARDLVIALTLSIIGNYICATCPFFKLVSLSSQQYGRFASLIAVVTSTSPTAIARAAILGTYRYSDCISA